MAYLINKLIPHSEQMYAFGQGLSAQAWYDQCHKPKLKLTIPAVPPVHGKGKRCFSLEVRQGEICLQLSNAFCCRVASQIGLGIRKKTLLTCSYLLSSIEAIFPFQLN